MIKYRLTTADKVLKLLYYPIYWIRTIGVRRELNRLVYDRNMVYYWNEHFNYNSDIHDKESNTIRHIIEWIKLRASNKTKDESISIMIKYARDGKGIYLPNRTIKHILYLMDAKERDLLNKLNY